MSNVCEHCGQGNRASAMFCIGCAGKLPGFSPSGPSALESMRGLSPRSRRAEAGAGDDASAALPSETRSFWLQLATIAALMMIGFMAWFMHVTSKPKVNVQRPMVQAPEPDLPQAATQQLLDRFSSASPVAPARPQALDRDLGTDRRVQAVENFYRALSAADGKTAASFVIPAKRGIGPFNEANMSRFYGSFERPLLVRSIRPINADLVEARYSYRVSRTTCEGTAIIETERVSQAVLIRRIRANC